jgi:hypothetical protein
MHLRVVGAYRPNPKGGGESKGGGREYGVHATSAISPKTKGSSGFLAGL